MRPNSTRKKQPSKNSTHAKFNKNTIETKKIQPKQNSAHANYTKIKATKFTSTVCNDQNSSCHINKGTTEELSIFKAS